MSCRNCGHRADEHPEGLHCEHATETPKQRTVCACPAYNVRPRVQQPELTDPERVRVLRAEVNDLDRQIGALTQRRNDAAVRLERLLAASPT